MPTTQQEKQLLALAGEFGVASELCRRGMQAAVTYGNSKKADVLAFGSEHNTCVRLEVKTTRRKRWPIGTAVRKSDAVGENVFWVFVLLPRNDSENAAPRYFVLTWSDVRELDKQLSDEYEEKYRKKHGKEFAGDGVPTLTLSHVEAHEGKWETIKQAIDRR